MIYRPYVPYLECISHKGGEVTTRKKLLVLLHKDNTYLSKSSLNHCIGCPMIHDTLVSLIFFIKFIFKNRTFKNAYDLDLNTLFKYQHFVLFSDWLQKIDSQSRKHKEIHIKTWISITLGWFRLSYRFSGQLVDEKKYLRIFYIYFFVVICKNLTPLTWINTVWQCFLRNFSFFGHLVFKRIFKASSHYILGNNLTPPPHWWFERTNLHYLRILPAK